MPEFCTCGAQLPEDARFCHKCGKPQRDEPLIPQAEEALPTPPPAPPTPAPLAAPPPEIGFHNGRAVRIAATVGILSFVAIAVAAVLTPVLLPLAGFAAAWFYQRRAGQAISVLAGARLGWITGAFGFLVSVILFTITVVGVMDPTVASLMKEQMKLRGLAEANVEQALTLLRTPGGIAQAVATMFVLFGTLPALGGALGARFGARRS